MKVYIVKTVSECEGYLIERINKVFSNKELSLKYAKGLQLEQSITLYDDTEEFIEGDIYIEEYDVEDNEFEYTCQQDLSDWVVDNWFTVADCIGFALQTMIVDSKKDIVNVIFDRDETVEFISERVKEGILNVIDTYEVEE